MHTGFQFIKVALHAKARLFHEVGGEKAVDGGHDPRVFLDVAVAEPEFGEGGIWFCFHPGTPLFYGGNYVVHSYTDHRREATRYVHTWVVGVMWLRLVASVFVLNGIH
jgi:hypothetical protein